MTERLIVGICGSPRKGGAEILLRRALAEAENRGSITTKIVLLRQEKISYCSGCLECSDPVEQGSGCQVHSDSMDKIVDLLLECHGLIMATPVYLGGPTAQLKTLMDRTEPLLRYVAGPWKSAMRNKIGAGIAVGGNRGGGQEATLQALHHFFFVHDMVVVGTGPEEWPGCYLGTSAWSGIMDYRSEDLEAVRHDQVGMRAAAIIGRRVAEAVGRMFR